MPNKPGCKVPGGVGGAKVDEGEPKPPAPKLSAEHAAKKAMVERNNSQKMHMVGKHGPEVPDSKFKQRAIDGTDPITGRRKANSKGNPSSRFYSWVLMQKAYTLATTRVEKGLPQFTGQDNKGANVVKMRLPAVGEGYVPNSKSKENPKLISDMGGFEMKFDPVTDVPFTLFPTK
jgi:hypothetical protein